ncbi:protein TONSOKU [Dorcoceras hygrometricum]|uniref:Protein TONSOKU n=1 Tax=Dorcoceras hygrometricum TaxID=472368 RepID=A0A2Z7CE05_9LAMI|nr:protein TONSOKU [Dorcoceras hygrometricum]
MMRDQRSINEAAAAGRPRVKRRQASPVMLDQRHNDLRRERPTMRPPACIDRDKMHGPRDETCAHVRMVSSAANPHAPSLEPDALPLIPPHAQQSKKSLQYSLPLLVQDSDALVPDPFAYLVLSG